MKIEMLSREAQEGLRRWGADVYGDEMLFDANASSPELWSWMYFQLRVGQDRPEWFPRGKWATIQAIEAYLSKEAVESMLCGNKIKERR